MREPTKCCSVCKSEKPLGEFHKDSRNPGGFSYRCKLCDRARQREADGITEKMERKEALLAEGKKVCTKCGETKLLVDFKLQKRKSGYFPTAWCRACSNVISLEAVKARYHSDPVYRAEHNRRSAERQQTPEGREKAKVRSERYRAKPEVKARSVERSAEWIAANPERHLANRAAWRDANREKVRDYTRRYRERNPEKYAMRNMLLQYARRWRIFNQGNVLTIHHMRLAQDFWGWKCAYCGAPTEAWVERPRTGLDHVVPAALGGANVPGNVVACCFVCNTKKNKRVLPEEIMAKLAPQLETFVSMLPRESYVTGMGRPTFAVLDACKAAGDKLRDSGIIVGTAW